MNTRLFCFLVVCLLASSCKRDNKTVRDESKVRNDTSGARIEVEPPRRLNVTYRRMPLNDSLLKVLDQAFDSVALKTVLAINRIDRRKLRASDTLVVPDTFATDFNSYSPFPQRMSTLDSVHKILICSYPLEAFAAYEHGNLVRWGPTSMGKQSTPTPTGLFHTNWKAKQTISTINEEWILKWYFNLTNFGGVSLHEYELPGYPASHSCVRLKPYDAQWIYYWAEQWRLSLDESILLAYGTPVIIFGSYDFKQRKPWLRLAGADLFAVSADSLDLVIKPFLPTVLQRQAARDSVLAGLSAAEVAINAIP